MVKKLLLCAALAAAPTSANAEGIRHYLTPEYNKWVNEYVPASFTGSSIEQAREIPQSAEAAARPEPEYHYGTRIRGLTGRYSATFTRAYIPEYAEESRGEAPPPKAPQESGNPSRGAPSR